MGVCSSGGGGHGLKRRGDWRGPEEGMLDAGGLVGSFGHFLSSLKYQAVPVPTTTTTTRTTMGDRKEDLLRREEQEEEEEQEEQQEQQGGRHKTHSGQRASSMKLAVLLRLALQLSRSLALWLSGSGSTPHHTTPHHTAPRLLALLCPLLKVGICQPQPRVNFPHAASPAKERERREERGNAIHDILLFACSLFLCRLLFLRLSPFKLPLT